METTATKLETAAPTTATAATVDAKALRAALGIVRKAIDPKMAMVVLTHVRVESRRHGLTLTGTRLTVSARVKVDAHAGRDWETLVPLRALTDLLKGAKGMLSLELHGRMLHVRSGAASRQIATMDAADFPEIPSRDAGACVATLPAGELARLLERTAYAASVDGTRPHLCGVCFECSGDGMLRAMATDGHRLVVAQLGTTMADWGAFVHGDALPVLATLTGAVAIYRTTANVWFIAGDVEVCARQIEAAFPAYNQVIPAAEPKRVLRVRRAELLEAATACAVGTDRTAGFAIDVAEGRVALSCSDGDQEARAAIDGAWSGAKPARVGMNRRYLMEALASTDDDVITLQITGELDPVRFDFADGTVGVVMPMRLD